MGNTPDLPPALMTEATGDCELLFNVLVANEIFLVRAEPHWNISTILEDIQFPRKSPSELLKRISFRRCNYYVVKNPFKIDTAETPISEIMASLGDQTKYEKVEFETPLEEIQQKFRPRHLNLVFEAQPASETDETGMIVCRLMQSDPILYQCLEIKVGGALKWTRDDVVLSGGIYVEGTVGKPPEILDVETRLRGRRSFNIPDGDHNLSAAHDYRSQFDLSYIPNDSSDDQATVKSSKEFLSFYVLLHDYLPDARRYYTAKSSSLKAHALKANFILPPFFSGRKPTDKLIYQEEMPWKFPLFVSASDHGLLTRRYKPKSDLSVWFSGLGLPLIISEVISEENEQDRYRMLLQAIALARLVFYLRRPGSASHPFIVAIYLTAELSAERYIVMKTGSTTNKVAISQTNFDLRVADDAAAFQREMYNLASVLESTLDQLDTSKHQELLDITKKACKMMSLHSSGAWTKNTKARTMKSIPEELENSGPQNEDDLGVFGDDDLCAELDQMGYKVAYIAFEHPNVAVIVSNEGDKKDGCLKFVKDGGEEINILQRLVDLPSEFNHTVVPICIRRVAGGSVIAMPIAGNPLTSLNDPDVHLWSLLTQLFEAVRFMHNHNVAHLDLKPSNILIPPEYGRLTIIDFGVSVQLQHPAQLWQGHAGTKGYIAPEVGQTNFSPIRADLWSTGKIVEELCMLCRPSPSRDWLLALSQRLLNNDPTKRPMMSTVLQMMSSYVAVKTLDVDHMSPFSLVPSGLASVGA